MKRIDQIKTAGTARLRKCLKGDDFFQAFPAVLPLPGSNLLAWYLDEFGQIINTDCAKMAFLKDGYTPGAPESVRKFHEAASKLVQQLIEEMFLKVKAGSYIYLMAGGNGSGKSTFCDGIRPILLDKEWVIDATMGAYTPAQRTISRALVQGLKPVIFWIKRSKDDAWNNGVLKRAAHGSHVTPQDVFENTHVKVPFNLAKLRNEFTSQMLPIIEIRND